MTLLRALLALGALTGLAAPEPPAAPQLLSQTGLYEAPGKVDRSHLAYAPQYPLWSDGAAKTRWLSLPKGTVIEAADEDAWAFPVGTKVWKEFSFGGRKIETRLMWRATAEAWVFASYQWNAAQTDATLVSSKGAADVAEIAPGKKHSIPSVSDCKACHDNAGVEVLGFNALQLSPDRDPGALHAEPLQPGMVTLPTLLDRGLLKGARKDLRATPPRIPGDAQLRPLLGYLTTNCGTCHRADAPLPKMNLDLRHTAKARAGGEEPLLRTALGQRGQFLIPGESGEGSLLIAPGDPARSAVLFRMKTRNPDLQMPAVGTILPDEAVVRSLEAWIRSLKPAPPSGGR